MGRLVRSLGYMGCLFSSNAKRPNEQQDPPSTTQPAKTQQKKMDVSSMDPAEAKPLVDELVLHDEDDTPVASKGDIVPIAPERMQVYAAGFADICTSGGSMMAVKCVGGRGAIEHVVYFADGQAQALVMECAASMEDLPPTRIVEYCFEEGGAWMLSKISLPMLESFRGGKFASWEKQMKEPTCKAAFRRMWQIGPVFRVYDHLMFPTPEADKDAYEVKNEQGQTVNIPHPVHALRIWNTETDSYDVVSAVLDGSPEDPAAYWAALSKELEETW